MMAEESVYGNRHAVVIRGYRDSYELFYARDPNTYGCSNVMDWYSRWAHDLHHNGMAYPDGMWDLNGDGVVDFALYCVNSDKATGGLDWLNHDSIVQHEVSHLFDAPDHGYYGPDCIMTYRDAYWG